MSRLLAKNKNQYICLMVGRSRCISSKVGKEVSFIKA